VNDARRVLVGLMSGTSLDGISAAVAGFTRGTDGGVSAELLAFRQFPYTSERRDRIAAALTGASPAEYTRLDFDLGHWLADAALAVIADAGVPRDHIDAIASHGQTVWHEPRCATWQCGQPAVIAERTGVAVIADFRVRDVAAGGEGAPLVPMADALLFSHPARWRALQNLGGIGNVTIVPPRGTLDAVRAFDTGPGMIVIDGVTERLAPPLRFDAEGVLARGGRVLPNVVGRVLEEPFFSLVPPRSTGRELFTPAWIDRFIADCRRESPDAGANDIIATAVQLTAASIAAALTRFVPEPVDEVLVSGGGTRNPVLLESVASAVQPRVVRRFSAEYFDDEAKEAVAFALLGYLHLMRQPGNLPRVTGARGPRILGSRTPA
jgi:anhydro-N-acetylmuramic acid kinase